MERDHGQFLDLPHLSFRGMSQVAVAGSTAYLSGQVALGPGGLVGDGDAAQQARQCFLNISGCLERLGSEVQEVVLLRAYLTPSCSYEAYAAAKLDFLAGHRPASTAVYVAALLDPRFLLELEAVVDLGTRRG